MFVWFDLLSLVCLPFPLIFLIKQSCFCHTFLELNNVLAAEKFGGAAGMEISVPCLLSLMFEQCCRAYVVQCSLPGMLQYQCLRIQSFFTEVSAHRE